MLYISWLSNDQLDMLDLVKPNLDESLMYFCSCLPLRGLLMLEFGGLMMFLKCVFDLRLDSADGFPQCFAIHFPVTPATKSVRQDFFQSYKMEVASNLFYVSLS